MNADAMDAAKWDFCCLCCALDVQSESFPTYHLTMTYGGLMGYRQSSDPVSNEESHGEDKAHRMISPNLGTAYAVLIGIAKYPHLRHLSRTTTDA
jgi:hypothetical protein